MAPPGLVIVDATFLQYLASERALARLESRCALANLRIWPSTINAIEALKHPNIAVRGRLVDAVARWAGDRPLIPWPPTLLVKWARAGARGEERLHFRGTKMDALVRSSSARANATRQAEQLAAQAETAFDAAHAAVRPAVQAKLKEHGLRDEWPTCRAFIVDQWSRPDMLAFFGTLIWRQLGMQGEAPTAAFVASEAWRIAVDGFGASVYQRAVRHQQLGNPAGQLDLLQLVTLSLHSRGRIFITNDNALHDAASAVLVGRFPNVRVMRAEEFLA